MKEEKEPHPNDDPEFEILFKDSDAAIRLPKCQAGLNKIKAKSVLSSADIEEERKIKQEIARAEFEIEKERFEYWQSVDPDRAEEHRQAMKAIAAKHPGLDLVVDPEPEAVEPVSQVVIPVPAGTTWDQIKLRIVNNERIEVSHSEGMYPYRAIELGFATKPALWTLLQLAGCSEGRLPPPTRKEATKQNFNNLKKHIRSLFPDIESDPIKHFKGEGYRCMFHVYTLPNQLSREHYSTDDTSEDAEYWEEIMGAK